MGASIEAGGSGATHEYACFLKLRAHFSRWPPAKTAKMPSCALGLPKRLAYASHPQDDVTGLRIRVADRTTVEASRQRNYRREL